MKALRLYNIFLVLLAVLISSCQTENEQQTQNPMQTQSPVPSDALIAVSSPTIGVTSRGMDPLQNLNLANFGISAIWNYDADTENQWYLSELPIIKNTSGGDTWVINPTSYWPIVGDLSFFFHAPSNVTDTLSCIKYIETTTGFPQVEFTPSTRNIAKQMDFCVGKPVMHVTQADGKVPVQLNHALTEILIKANYKGIVPPGYFMLIDEVKIKGVVGTKKASYSETEPYITWEDESAREADSTYTLTRKSTQLRSDDSIHIVTKDSIYYPIYNSPGRLYLLPQTLTSAAKLEVVYGFYYNWGASPTLIAQFDKEISLPVGQQWPIGKTLTYLLTVDVGISSPLQLNTVITDWTSSGNTFNNGDTKIVE